MAPGYGYGGEYNAAWSDSPKLGVGHPGAPPSPGLSPGLSPGAYRQPSAGGKSDEYDYRAGTSRTSSFSSAHPRADRGKVLDEEDRTAYIYALRVA